jgi:hypothetical protein
MYDMPGLYGSRVGRMLQVERLHTLVLFGSPLLMEVTWTLGASCNRSRILIVLG